jgi:hypothetical protein
MTELEWSACDDPFTILVFANRNVPPLSKDQKANRRAILFTAACCSRIKTKDRSRLERESIEWLFSLADNEPTKRDKQTILMSLERASKRRDANEQDALIAIRTAVSETRISNFYAAVYQIAKRISRAVAQGNKEI